jgi:PAS domain S-box-containing protein
MHSYPVPANDEARVNALHEYHILDTLQEQSYDDIVLLASQICDVPTALITFVDRDRQWFKARIGIDAPQTPREQSFCTHAIMGREIFTVPDAAHDPRFQANPAVVGAPHIRFYAGAPLINPDGFALGTLCVADNKVRKLTDEQTEALAALSRQVVAQLELARQRTLLSELLEEHKQTILLERGLNAILQNSVEGIARIDVNGMFAAVNKRYAAAAGYTPEQMLGMPWESTIHPDSVAAAQQALAAMHRAGRAESELMGLRKTGAPFHKHVILVPVFDQQQMFQGY